MGDVPSEEEAQFVDEFKLLCMRMRRCKACVYSVTRKRVVPPTGPTDATVAFVGEAPGDVENEKGLPFVGHAGRKLEDWLDKIGLHRDWVYITNRVKCRPVPHGRPCEASLICDYWLMEELMLISPKVIVPLGNTALRFFMPRASTTVHHGKVYDWGGVKLVPMFHPAHCLYSADKWPGMKTDIYTVAELITIRRDVNR